MWFDRSLFAGLLLVAAWGVQSAACGGAVVFDGPWPSGSGGTGGAVGVAGGATASTAATGTGGAGSGAGTGGGSGACSNRACSGMESACDCTATCAGIGDIEVNCGVAPGGAGCECLQDGGVSGSCSEPALVCDPPTSCCNAVFFGHGG